MTKLVASDHLGTPEYILDRVYALGPVALDPCSGPNSQVIAAITCTPDSEIDGLAMDWSAVPFNLWCGGHFRRGVVYVNCPYGRGHLGPWTTKIVAEASKGCEIVSLLPLDPTTKWWKRMTSTAQARVMIDHRVQFVGGSHKSGSIKSALFYHGTRPRLFLHHCGVMGEKTLLGGGERSLSFPVPGATEIDGIVMADDVWESVAGPEAFAQAIADRADVRLFVHADCPAKLDAWWRGGDGKTCPFCGESG